MPVVEAALDIIHAYVMRLNECALTSDGQQHSLEEDSQEYGSDVFSDVQLGILEYVGVCDPSLLDYVRLLILFRLLTASYCPLCGMFYTLRCDPGFQSSHLLGRRSSKPGH